MSENRHGCQNPDTTVTTRQAREICEAVIDQAIEDYQSIPNDAPTRRVRNAAERDRQSAIEFLFGEDSNFPWMAKGLGIDIEVIRAALLERGQVQPTNDARYGGRLPGRTYGSVIERAARLVG